MQTLGSRPAMLFQRLADGRVRCGVCAHQCTIADGQRGRCQVRQNEGGTLYALGYGRAVGLHVDPVEKKPLYHFYPGSTAYSLAAAGCNLTCRWCQNWQISQVNRTEPPGAGQPASPEQVVAAAQAAGCRSIAYTYTEPTVFFEYTRDTAELARAAGLANVYVTNGYMTRAALEALHPYLDAANVDLKAFRDQTYRTYTDARLQPVLDSLLAMGQLGVWREVTTLLIPGVNDDPAELRDAAHFLAQELGAQTPWHLSRFFPNYRLLDAPPTPLDTLERARQIGLEAGLRYVYVGNVRDEAHTRCHACGALLIRRAGFAVTGNRIDGAGRCPDCGAPVAGVGMEGPETT